MLLIQLLTKLMLKNYNINIKNITYFKQRKYDIIILAVSHKIFKKIRLLR